MAQRNHVLTNAYNSMRQRCYNPKNPRFNYYGGRGITVCEKWINDKWEFIAWAYEAGWRPGLSLNRIDNDGPYSPQNCEWSTQSQQNNNTRRSIKLTAFGESKTLTEWSNDPRSTVSSANGIRHRMNTGMSPEDAISAPTRPGRRSDLNVMV